MKRAIKLLPIFLSSFLMSATDLTVIGSLINADGLGRLALGCIECLKNDLSINFIPTAINPADAPADFSRFMCINPHMGHLYSGNVAILFSPLWYPNCDYASKVPAMSKIKIAYSMIESSSIIPKWVDILNNKFDAVAVPDDFLVDVYKNSGVKIPIFVLPHGMTDLEDFFNMQQRKKRNKAFTFGISGAVFDERKNHVLVLDAFAKEFGNNPHFKLKVHARLGDERVQQKIAQKIKDLKINNVEFVYKNLSARQYREFIASLDCYVLLSAGEGFSVSPREALALGIPVIISDNTAHSTISRTGLVLPVPAKVEKPAYYNCLGSFSGNYKYCTLEDARAALRHMVDNYNHYAQKARSSRQWLEQYLYRNRRPKYLALVKPREVRLGDCNRLDDYCLTTNSKNLYEKYKSIL